MENLLDISMSPHTSKKEIKQKKRKKNPTLHNPQALQLKKKKNLYQTKTLKYICLANYIDYSSALLHKSGKSSPGDADRTRRC